MKCESCTIKIYSTMFPYWLVVEPQFEHAEVYDTEEAAKEARAGILEGGADAFIIKIEKHGFKPF